MTLLTCCGGSAAASRVLRSRAADTGADCRRESRLRMPAVRPRAAFAAERRACVARGLRPRSSGRLDRPPARRHWPDARRSASVLARSRQSISRRSAPRLDWPRRNRGYLPLRRAGVERSCTTAPERRDDSLAAAIAVMTAPTGSNLNPVRPDERLGPQVFAARRLHQHAERPERRGDGGDAVDAGIG